MKTNKPNVFKEQTHGGSPADRINNEQMLRRSVMACLLWEKTFYEDGEDNAARIASLIPLVDEFTVARIAIEAREKMHLRHTPLFITRELARSAHYKWLVSNILESVIQRADELTEFLSLYWKDGKQPLAAQVKKGLARAFVKFNKYQLAKYNRDDAIKLRDVLFLCHAKPKDKEQEQLWKDLINGKLEPPDTWEVALSTGKDKRETWERLISENKLGGLAFIRNLRNMRQSNVDESFIKEHLLKINTSKILPFRFIAAARSAPEFENELDELLIKSVRDARKLHGKTVIVIDVSGSMYGKAVSEKSDMDRALVACSLGAIARELCENPKIYATAGNDSTRIHQTKLVPSRRGISLVDAIYNMCRPLGGGGIFLTPVCEWIGQREKDVDRMIVITDEQDCAGSGSNSPSNAKPLGKTNYLINVATYKNGIGYGKKWLHIDGWSEHIFDYILAYEDNDATQ